MALFTKFLTYSKLQSKGVPKHFVKKISNLLQSKGV